jgi:di/tricarboxylate transporter
MFDAYLVFLVLVLALGLFIWGYWRYDVVALIALVLLVLFGVIQPNEAFLGLANPAVTTVACVMIITQAITQSGIVDQVVKRITPITSNIVLHIGALTVITATLSAFMNNVGALALMMPIAIQSALNNQRSPSLVLMPIAFGSVLGGMTTAIGTPPNLLISAYRQQITGYSFNMFDFTPVGLVVAVACILFIALIGWRLIPKNRKGRGIGEDLFQMQNYISELVIPDKSPFVGLTRHELEQKIEIDFQIIGLIRNKQHHFAISPSEVLQADDILIVQADHEKLQQLVRAGQLELAGGEVVSPDILSNRDIAVMEAVVPPGSRLENRCWARMGLRYRYRLNLLAIARQGETFNVRLNHVDLQAGDVILVQGEADILRENIVNLGLLPLAERGVQVGMRPKALLSVIIFVAAIVLATLQIFPIQVAFTFAVVALVITKIIPVRQIYSSIDWSVIILLAALIPIGTAMQATGGTDLIANAVTAIAGHVAPIVIIGLLMVVTMTLSDIMNNAATAVLMAPIGVSIAQFLNVSIDPFLIAVAIGASCSFLTPISHQNNTLVMGPGGYKFFDYLRLGLPIEILVLAISLPMIMWVWPI